MTDEKLYQEMVFGLEEYKYEGDNDDERRAAMWKDISSFLRVLFKNNCIATIYDDDRDIIVVRYEHNDLKGDYWGVPNPYWITADEYERILMDRSEPSEACPDECCEGFNF